MAALPALEPSDDFWQGKRAEIRAAVAKSDPDSFLAWACVQATMFVGEAPYLKAERADLDDGTLLSCRDTNDIHQAYHLHQWEKRAVRRVSDLKTIVEFGGGYGALARVSHALGFTGRYVLVDLPELLLLQEFYLSGHGVQAEYRTIEKFRPTRCDLFIAIRSLSECDRAVRDAALAKARARGFLFNYAGAESEEYFHRFASENSKALRWARYETPHLPTNTYRIGWEKGKA